MATKTEWLTGIMEKWGGMEGDQMIMGHTEESLAEHRYLVVEHGRDCSRRWITAFDDMQEVLTYAVEHVREDEWAFTAAYDMDTREELELTFHAALAGRKPTSEPT